MSYCVVSIGFENEDDMIAWYKSNFWDHHEPTGLYKADALDPERNPEAVHVVRIAAGLTSDEVVRSGAVATLAGVAEFTGGAT